MLGKQLREYGATVEVWEWISNFIPHFIRAWDYLSMLRLKLIHASKRRPSWLRHEINLPRNHLTKLSTTKCELKWWNICSLSIFCMNRDWEQKCHCYWPVSLLQFVSPSLLHSRNIYVPEAYMGNRNCGIYGQLNAKLWKPQCIRYDNVLHKGQGCCIKSLEWKQPWKGEGGGYGCYILSFCFEKYRKQHSQYQIQTPNKCSPLLLYHIFKRVQI